MSYFIDANIFLRVLIKEDEKNYRDCFQLLSLVSERKIEAFTSSLVFAEIDWVIEGFYEFGKKEAIKSLESILKLKGLKITNTLRMSLALELYKNHNIKFIDALIASNPQIFQKKMIVVSYDKDFDKLKIKRLEPKEVLKIETKKSKK
jgi:predicted nucleic-acid-binding protein